MDLSSVINVIFYMFSTGIYDKFAEAFSEAVQKLEVGDGFKEGTTQVCLFRLTLLLCGLLLLMIG